MRKKETPPPTNNERSTPNKRRKWARRAGVVALAGVVIGYGAYFARDVGRDALHDPTTQEQAIEHVMEEAYGADIWNVRCLDDDAMAAQRNPFAPWPRLDSNFGSVPYIPTANTGMPKFFLPYVRLHQDVCDDASAFMRQPPQKPTDVDNDLLRSLHTIAHEARHREQVHNEAQADCEAMQVIHKLAIAMGASGDAAMEVQERNTRFTGSKKSEERLGDCFPRGQYDLKLWTQGIEIYFPYGPPGTPDRDRSVLATP
jgi:hypothetical protein